MQDANGKPMEAGRLYALTAGSRSFMAIFDGEIFKPCVQQLPLLSLDTARETYMIERSVDWTARSAREAQVAFLLDARERAERLQQQLFGIEVEVCRRLFGGYTQDSRDRVMGFVRDGIGTAEDLLAQVKAGA